MDLLIGALIFLPFLTLIIAIHELGHFFVARKFGMKVTEYFVGFGPWKIWSRRRGELEYGVKPIFVGGYVKIAGMNPYEENPVEDTPRLYGSKPIWQRALTIFAGPGTHFAVAALIFAIGFTLFGDPSEPLDSRELVVDVVEPTLNGETSPAVAAGLESGDLIVRLGDVERPTSDELSEALTAQVEDRPGEAIEVVVDRDGTAIELQIVPQPAEVEGRPVGRLGVIVALSAPDPMAPGEAIVQGASEVGRSVALSFEQIGRVFSPSGVGRTFGLLFNDEAREPDRDPTSVVGLSQQVGVIGSEGEFAWLFYVFGFVTVFIGLINLVPLPPFDGGHLLMLGIEKVRGKAVDMRTLIPISAAVMAFFVMFVGATIVLDVTKPITIP